MSQANLCCRQLGKTHIEFIHGNAYQLNITHESTRRGEYSTLASCYTSRFMEDDFDGTYSRYILDHC